ncbi:DUF943 family protein [Cronobacter dublinensis]
MKLKATLVLIFIVILAIVLYSVQGNEKINVMDVHRDDFAPVIVVKNFPSSPEEKITWWVKQSPDILARYSLKNKSAAIVRNFYIYDFGKGYQPLGKEDRLCFAGIKAPDNCLDKHILMIVRERKDGHTQFDINNETWQTDSHGDIVKYR